MTLWDRCKRLLSGIPPHTRGGKTVRNMVFCLLLALICFTMTGMPFLGTVAAYRRMERRFLIERGDILEVFESRWVGWREETPLVVAENEDRYILAMPEYYYGIEAWEKQGDVTLMAVLEGEFANAAMPFVLVTKLPAVRAEIGFTLSADEDWWWQTEFKGLTCLETAEGKNGVFLFSLPGDLEEKPNYTMQEQQEIRALSTFRYILTGQAGLFDITIPVTIRLWDGQGTLIYDETQIYGAERGDAGGP